MRLIDADRLKWVLEKNFGHTGGAAVLAQLIDAQETKSQLSVNRTDELISKQAAIKTALEFTVEYLGGAFDEQLQWELKKELESLPSLETVNSGYLCDWFINSVGDEEPVWTEEHIDELTNDFYVIPKNMEMTD